MARPRKIFDKVLKLKLSFLAKALLYTFDTLDIENDGFSSWLKEIFSKSDDLNFPDWSKHYGKVFDLSEVLLIFKEVVFSDVMVEVEEEATTFDLDNFYENFSEHAKDFEAMPISNMQRDKAKSWVESGKLNPFLNAYAVIVYVLCHALFEESLHSLIKKGKSGNRDAIFKLIQIDKTLIGKEWVVNEIRKAQVLQDQDFLDNLASALKERPLKPHPDYYRLYLVLGYLWGAGLKDMKVEELWEFCCSLGIYHNDLEPFRKLINRFKKTI